MGLDTVSALCDCEEDCEQRVTDCCEVPRRTCETVFWLDANGDPDVLVCKRGFGCDDEGSMWPEGPR